MSTKPEYPTITNYLPANDCTPEEIMAMDYRKHLHPVQVEDIKEGDFLQIGSGWWGSQSKYLVKVCRVTPKLITYKYVKPSGAKALRVETSPNDVYTYYISTKDYLDFGSIKRRTKKSMENCLRVELDPANILFVHSTYFDYSR